MEMLNATLLGEMLTFIVLVFVTVKYVWPPIMQAINARQKQIAEGLAAAERGQHDLELARSQAIRIIQEAKGQAQDLLDNAKQQSNSIIEHSHMQAKVEGARLLQLAQTDIAKEKIAAQQDLQQHVINLVLLTTEKFLRANVSAVANKQLLDMLTMEIQSNENR